MPDATQNTPARHTHTRNHKAILAAFAGSMFLSAMLMFSVQPMVGKMMLPLIGGAPSGWIVALAFFQISLLAGYAISHVLSLAPPRIHGAGLLVLCLACLFVLPVDFAAGWQQTAMKISAFNVFTALVLSTALPFVTLAVVTPTLQRMFNATGHAEAEDPYFLYAASNMGSFLGLISYPFIIEPGFTLPEQAHGWGLLFGLLCALVLACLMIIMPSRPTPSSQAAAESPAATPKRAELDENVTWKRRGFWAGLAFVTSSLTVGITMHITTDITPIPMLWVLPLGLFLLTYVMAFARKRRYTAASINSIQPLLVCVVLLQQMFFSTPGEGVAQTILLHLAAFTATALMCHTRLADTRPAANRLTDFYLMIALGGALGGAFNAFLAPVIFKSMLEYPLVLAVSLLFHPGPQRELPENIQRLGKNGMSVAMAGLALMLLMPIIGLPPGIGVVAMLVFTLGVMFCIVNVRSMAAVLLAATVVLHLPVLANIGVTFQQRNFFGIWYVNESTHGKDHRPVRQLIHNTTIHGVEFMDEKDKPVPTQTGYYAEGSPLSDLMQLAAPQRVGVFGLGTGEIACFRHEGRSFRFYEIDPDIVTIAEKYFTFLDKCPEHDIIIGDGRLALAADTQQDYDLLILDAFSSDGVPSHLLTREAIGLYLERTKAHNGVILLHLTNRFLDLVPVAAATAQAMGLKTLSRSYIPDEEAKEKLNALPTTWLVLLRQDADAQPYTDNGWAEPDVPPGTSVWSDNFSNLLDALF